MFHLNIGNKNDVV